MTKIENTNPRQPSGQPNNPHDRFARKTLGNLLYAGNFLLHYADPVVVQNVNLNNLTAAPTHQLSENLKEVLSDISFAAHLQDNECGSDVLLFLEHKSKPSRFVPLQLGAQCLLFLYAKWTETGYAENYVPPIPLMILVYNGEEDIDEEMFLQNIFPTMNDNLRQYVPQCRIVVINLKRYNYDNLPGSPEVQAIAESLKRATDGTFGEHLSGILERVKSAQLGVQQTLDLVTNIVRYCTWVTAITKEQVTQSITKTFNGTENIEMVNNMQKGMIQEALEIGEARGEARGIGIGEARGIEIGEKRGELKGKIELILDVLGKRFGRVPQYIIDSLNERHDV
ncbi:MAG: Rpn family recombination-promoting nuclease/putative transposase, partial [Planctomycetaceae bacterium]|nr:Rpn family recombination-promoting nuclease/putative transposase [Planctomycetaceae bacterium]